ncbi:unnamed protein product [Citrullus colocynthis]|uniref:Uncharacterized protein n=1 Tax=Citrullus colocynthis TaxID=252529 RepID=A0ABP0Z8E8_9ROSI
MGRAKHNKNTKIKNKISSILFSSAAPPSPPPYSRMGTVKLCLFLLLIAAATIPLALAFPDDWARAYGAPDYAYWASSTPAAMEDNRRLLFQYGFAYKYPRNKYLSYDALRKNNIPCGRRGTSYYDCRKRRKANPYRRGCTAITGCARFTD